MSTSHPPLQPPLQAQLHLLQHQTMKMRCKSVKSKRRRPSRASTALGHQRRLFHRYVLSPLIKQPSQYLQARLTCVPWYMLLPDSHETRSFNYHRTRMTGCGCTMKSLIDLEEEQSSKNIQRSVHYFLSASLDLSCAQAELCVTRCNFLSASA